MEDTCMSEEPQLVCVYTCQGWDVAQIYKSKLEAAGIPVLLSYESAGLVYGITVDGLGAVRVMVPERYAAEAEALLTGNDEWAGEDFEDAEAPFIGTQEPLEEESEDSQEQNDTP
jgi:hypothetical protein